MPIQGFQPDYLKLEEAGDIVVVEFLLTTLNEEENIEQLGLELFALQDQLGFSKILIRTGNVEFATSSVLGKLITLHRRLHRDGGQLVICESQGVFQEVLESSRLVTYFTIVDTYEDGLQLLNEETDASEQSA